MSDNPQLGLAKAISVMLTIVTAFGMSYILYQMSNLIEGNSLLYALINMSIFGMVSVFHFFAIGTITSSIFRMVGRVSGSRWPKRLAWASAAVVWAIGLISSLKMFTT